MVVLSGIRVLQVLVSLFVMIKGNESNGFLNIICETDSLSYIELILKDKQSFHPHHALIRCVRDLVALDWNITFKHTFREANQCANWLAKDGGSSSSTC
ncbi:hypothetical protein JHK82_046140 [Glycine max]|uniref:RNase H type-1 domain-containing protein n=2 Tax=Glycine subgen. Soja TaxID=1462606 RepID=K7MFC2_SOYBN|nr:hypothetical protein JHK86_044474 [Glycine max]KAG4940432.1 hypothetical protein JHK87_044303 [Glycine soja]KAG4951202.1 hypothetical protein JHK85_045069 [Glycine max]KAG5101088.1 hypothetical protein JHK82_046140 [Glycine max]KAG5107675.1 hypothetical protein JHK84_044582 [Glycine max]